MRRVVRTIAALFCAVLLFGAVPKPTAVSVDAGSISAENARWTALGLRLPQGGVVLEHPYDAPFSNRSFVVPVSWYSPYFRTLRAKKDYPVKAADLREDLPILHLLMSRAYSGYEIATQRGWNWDRWFADWDARLAQAGDATLSLHAAFAPLGDLAKVQLDNHSGVGGLTDFVSGSVSAVLRTAPQGVCTRMVMSDGTAYALNDDPGQQPHAVEQWDGTTLTPAYYVGYPKARGTVSALECANGRIDATMTAEGAVETQPPVYETLADGIGYLRLPNFDDATDEKIRAVADHLPATAGKERVLIVDLRGNGGGNATPEILTHWVSQQLVDRGGELRQVGTNGCFRTALTFALQQLLSAGVKAPLSPALHDDLQQQLDGLAGPKNGDCTPQRYVKNASWALKDHRLSIERNAHDKPRIVAIVDNGCGSDCEYMAGVIGSLPGSVIVGTSTYGVLGFTQPGYFVLPHTRIVYRLALSRTDVYGDDRSVDGYGISVDVLLPTPQSQTMESILELAKRLQ